MLLEHLSRERAEAYRDRRPYAVISLTDPGTALARLQDDPNRLGLLTLQFHDISQRLQERGHGVVDTEALREFAREALPNFLRLRALQKARGARLDPDP